VKIIYTPAKDDSHEIETEKFQRLEAGVETEVPEDIALALLRDHPTRFRSATALPIIMTNEEEGSGNA
jgi:hypothetical protein